MIPQWKHAARPQLRARRTKDARVTVFSEEVTESSCTVGWCIHRSITAKLMCRNHSKDSALCAKSHCVRQAIRQHEKAFSRRLLGCSEFRDGIDTATCPTEAARTRSEPVARGRTRESRPFADSRSCRAIGHSVLYRTQGGHCARHRFNPWDDEPVLAAPACREVCDR